MAHSRETILLPGLLLAVLLLAAAPGDADAAAVQGCQPEALAPPVALFCARGQPAVWCCQALAHSARVGGGAGCLCRLAAEEPLVRVACFCHVPLPSSSFSVGRIAGLHATGVGSGPGAARDLAGMCPSRRGADGRV